MIVRSGNEEYPVEPNLVVTLTARDDALFLYLNNAVVGVPGLVDACEPEYGKRSVAGQGAYADTLHAFVCKWPVADSAHRDVGLQQLSGRHSATPDVGK